MFWSTCLILVFLDECDRGEVIVSVSMKPGSTTQHIQLDKILPPIPPSPTVSTMVQALPEMVSSPMVQPMMSHPPGYLVMLPHPNFMIPISDNFAGPINTNVSISAEANGQDLLLHGKTVIVIIISEFLNRCLNTNSRLLLVEFVKSNFFLWC